MARPREQTGRRAVSVLLGLVVPILLFAAWFFGSLTGAIKPYQLASPGGVATEIAALWSEGLLVNNIAASAERVAAGFALAFALAVAVGGAVGLSRTTERLFDPTLQAIRAVPSLAWVPLLLLWLGIGETAKIALVTIGAFFPIYVNFVAGIRNVDRKLVEVGYVLGYATFERAWRIVLPASLPFLLVGARIGLTQAWLFLVAAELLASTRGLGYMLTEGQQIARTDEILAAILLLALCGKLSESAMRTVERRALRWTDTPA